MAMTAAVTEPNEVHVEHLLGRRIRDVHGVVVGRIEELCVDDVDGQPCIVEIHAGPAALLERMGAFIHQLPFFALLPYSPALYRIPWSVLDLRDQRHPRVSVAKRELMRS